MPFRYLTIEKANGFQNRVEEWGNTYLYDMSSVTDGDYTLLINNVVAAEKAVHAADVTFKRARVYTTQGLNNVLEGGSMYKVVELTGTGSMAAGGSIQIYRECAILVKWPLPRKDLVGGALGRQRSLKKWVRSCSSAFMTAAALSGASSIPQAAIDHYTTYGNAVLTPTPVSQLSAPDGAEPNAAVQIHPYLEHRQFPRGRKEGE